MKVSVEVTLSWCLIVTKFTFIKFLLVMISLVFIQMDLGSPNPATLSTGKGLCPMHGLDMLTEVITILHGGITDGTSCYNSFVNNFFMPNPALII